MQTRLSKDALAVLELLPLWRLRAEKTAPSKDRPSGLGRPLLVLIAAPMSDREGRLWQQISRALAHLHLQHRWLDDRLVLSAQDQARIVREISAHDPQHLLIFGASLEPAVTAALSGLDEAKARLIVVPSLSELIDQPGKKAAAWAIFCGLGRRLRAAQAMA